MTRCELTQYASNARHRCFKWANPFLFKIESAISAGQSDAELLVLQSEMKELIDLTEESVLSHEKSKLLAILDEIADDNNEVSLISW